MKHWVFTFRVDPPANKVISVRFGSSVMFAAYSPLIRQWYHVYPGGEEKIEAPPMWFCEDEWASAHPSKNFYPTQKAPRKSKRPEQLQLF